MQAAPANEGGRFRTSFLCDFVFALWIIFFFVGLELPALARTYPWETQGKQESAGFSSRQDRSPEELYRRADGYFKGRGPGKDLPRAFELYLQSAARGYPAALYMVGVCYEYGWGTPKDLGQAFHFYLLAARQGHPKAQFKVGIFYFFGKGRKRDFKEAYKWYVLSVKQGIAPALNNLGVLYEHGLGTRKDPEKAFRLYELAARKGNAFGYKNFFYLSKKLRRPFPENIGKRVRLGIYDLQASEKWVRLPPPDNKKENRWIMGYMSKRGTNPNPLILFRPDSFGYTNTVQRKELEEKFIDGMKVKKTVDVQSVKVAGHKTIVVRNYDGNDTAFTLLSYDDIALHLIVVMYSGKNVATLMPEVRSYLAAMVIRAQ